MQVAGGAALPTTGAQALPRFERRPERKKAHPDPSLLQVVLQEAFWLRFVLSAVLSARQNRPGRTVSHHVCALARRIVRIRSSRVNPIFTP